MDDLESIVYGLSIATSIACGVIGIKHRGDDRYSKLRKINISDGSGWSAKIIKKFPKYSVLSPVVDHVMAGVGLTLGIGGIMGIIYSDPILDNPPIKSFYHAAYSYWVLSGLWELDNLNRRKDFSDGLQILADVATPVAVLYGMSQILT